MAVKGLAEAMMAAAEREALPRNLRVCTGAFSVVNLGAAVEN